MAREFGGTPELVTQIGRESGFGVIVSATEIWQGAFGGYADERIRNIADEEVGILGVKRVYDSMLGASATLPDSPLTFEQVCHLLEMGITTATPTGTGPYTREYGLTAWGVGVPPTSYTVEVGNKVVASDNRLLPGSVMTQIRLRGRQGEKWMMGGVVQATRVEPGTLTPLLDPIDVEEALFAETLLYIDDDGGTIGTTLKEDVLLGAEIIITTGIQFVPVGDGNLWSSRFKVIEPSVQLNLTLDLEHVATVSQIAEQRYAYEGNDAQLIHLSCAGTAGRLFEMDLSVRWMNLGIHLPGADKNTTVTFTGLCEYNEAAALHFATRVTNHRPSL